MERPDIPYFDAHCDTIHACGRDGRMLCRNEGHLDLARLSRFTRAAQIFALYADSADLAGGSCLPETIRLHNIFLSEMDRNPGRVRFCRTGTEIAAAAQEGIPAALLSIEGSELLDCRPENLSLAAQWGIRSINLTWNHANQITGSHCDRPEQGLTDLGRVWVREAERLHIFLDVSHVSDRGFWDIVNITSNPILATHSNARAVCGHSRNLTDDMFRAICETGGVVGVNFYADFVGGTGSMEDIRRHIDHFMELGGEKHLALGGDWDGCDPLAGGMNGVQDLPLLWNHLSRHGYDPRTLEDIFFGNLFRVLQ